MLLVRRGCNLHVASPTASACGFGVDRSRTLWLAAGSQYMLHTEIRVRVQRPLPEYLFYRRLGAICTYDIPVCVSMHHIKYASVFRSLTLITSNRWIWRERIRVLNTPDIQKNWIKATLRGWNKVQDTIAACVVQKLAPNEI